jgi:DNA-binding beta-propeller fold protein YncE
MFGASRQVAVALGALGAGLVVIFCFAGSAGSTAPVTEVVQLPGGEAGIGFDDLQYAPGLRKVLVPGGRSGRLFLISPGSREIAFVDGFTSKTSYTGGHGDGTTSACEGGSLIYASDRGSRSVKIVDPAAGKIIASVALANSPDYVRCLPEAHEIWVTEPGKEQIEVLVLADDGRSAKQSATVAVPGGPESLILDARRMRGYTHTWKGTTYVLDLKLRAVAGKWSNGCEGARGIALDEKRGFLFVGCEEGKAVVLDTATGKVISSLRTGPGVDSIRYGAELEHLYVPGGDSADVSILGVSASGQMTLLGKVKTGPDAHTAAFDPAGHAVFIGLPEHGQVLMVQDGFKPPTP